jgi:hypothetical protein
VVENDNPALQKQRIAEAVHEVLSECQAVFDEHSFKGFVHFRIDHVPTGHIAAGPVSEHASVFADYSDERLRDFIEALAPYYTKSGAQ